MTYFKRWSLGINCTDVIIPLIAVGIIYVAKCLIPDPFVDCLPFERAVGFVSFFTGEYEICRSNETVSFEHEFLLLHNAYNFFSSLSFFTPCIVNKWVDTTGRNTFANMLIERFLTLFSHSLLATAYIFLVNSLGVLMLAIDDAEI